MRQAKDEILKLTMNEICGRIYPVRCADQPEAVLDPSSMLSPRPHGIQSMIDMHPARIPDPLRYGVCLFDDHTLLCSLATLPCTQLSPRRVPLLVVSTNLLAMKKDEKVINKFSTRLLCHRDVILWWFNLGTAFR